MIGTLMGWLRHPLAVTGTVIDVLMPRGVDPHLRHFLALRNLTESLNVPQPCGATDPLPEDHVPLSDWWKDSWWEQDDKRSSLRELLAAQRAADIAIVADILASFGEEELFDVVAARIVDALEGTA